MQTDNFLPIVYYAGQLLPGQFPPHANGLILNSVARPLQRNNHSKLHLIKVTTIRRSRHLPTYPHNYAAAPNLYSLVLRHSMSISIVKCSPLYSMTPFDVP